MIDTVGIIGGGAWGTALAVAAQRAGRNVIIWARDEDTVTAINRTHENTRHLLGVALDPAIRATNDLAEAARTDLPVLAVPAQAVRAVAGEASTALRPGAALILAAKGLERETAKRMSEVVSEAAPQAVPAILSGPSFAADVARGLPTAVTIAAADADLAFSLCQAFAGPTFRPYAETDIAGVEIGGAIKNVLAIAAGIVAGRHLGASALAALIARSFAELRRLGEALGARPETLMGLSGLGDLVLTCTGSQSRNFAYGETIGAGGSRWGSDRLVEGIATAHVARDLAATHNVETPIIGAVAAILDGSLSIDAAIEGLLARPLRHEAG
jgi:glycerol-3-phosphate dehydrogenase (NAD(P)+)